ncbi:MAG: hypothetical protein ACFB8W_13515 [Elainellaceae cyanobacterium]
MVSGAAMAAPPSWAMIRERAVSAASAVAARAWVVPSLCGPEPA